MPAHFAKSSIALAIVGVAMLASPLTASAAVTTTAGTTEIQFTGEVSTSTCQFKNAASIIALDKISSSLSAGTPPVGGRKHLKIEVSDCGATPLDLKLNFEVDANVNPTTGRLKLPVTSDGTTDDLELRILDEKLQPINLFDNTHPSTVKSDTSGNASFEYEVEYFVGAGTIHPGARSTTLKATLAYP
jgi:type 1 fimbria pilin